MSRIFIYHPLYNPNPNPNIKNNLVIISDKSEILLYSPTIHVYTEMSRIFIYESDNRSKQNNKEYHSL